MAEVLVTTQTIPIMTLHSADAYHGHGHGHSSSQQSHHSASRSTSQVPRQYGAHNVSVPYRGPVAPYAFQSTPNLRQETRQTPAPSAAAVSRQSVAPPNTLANNRQSYAPSSSASTASSNSASNASSNTGQYTLAADDTTLGAKTGERPVSTFLTSSSTPDLTLISFGETPASKPSPDRYRRSTKRADSNASTTSTQQPQAGGGQRWSQQWPTPQAAHQAMATAFKAPTPPTVHTRSESANDIDSKQAGLGRYRRRSVGALDPQNTSRPAPTATQSAAAAPTWSQIAARGHSPQAVPVTSANAGRPIGHHRTDSAGSHSSTGSNTARRPVNARQESYASTKSTASSHRPSTAPANAQRAGSPRMADAGKRVISPSPLSKPVANDALSRPGYGPPKSPGSPAVKAATPAAPTPAVQQLSALQDRDPNKGMKSRLRRAFSFGSAQELRKASAQNNVNKTKKDQSEDDELHGEDAAIAAQQEAAGFGTGIYSGQGGVYGSTDNLSIQSTASSASVMLRKMGRGMKKSTKSLRGLFRPKSIIGDPAADEAVAAPSGTSPAIVSLVTVEAEQSRTNINVNPHDQPGGGTGYPKLERNSLDTAPVPQTERPNSSRHGHHDSVNSRRSIIGSDRERQEVLAAVKKGILKRNNTSSPVPAEPNPSEVNVPSLPSTPDSSKQVDQTFFLANNFGNNSTRSLPNGPMRNISWNPKVQFFDVWSPHEYDRKGDIATCNRLTPMLAQQIKEELNSFKMEMEVHADSKFYTHFF